MNEFEMIERYFAPLTMGRAGSAGLQDDAAVVAIPDGHELVVTSDTVNEGIHFLENSAPAHIAKKALRVNLSDLAAMGAEPLCYQMNIAFPQKPTEEWLSAFSRALLADNHEYGVYCSGGDTTSIQGDALSVSITAMGIVPKGKAVRRGGAQDGDCLVITGEIGDAVLGLKALQEELQGYENAVSRYRMPRPRCSVVDIVQKYAHAATDISDGFLADSLHIGKASGLGVALDFDVYPFSDDVRQAIDAGVLSFDSAVKGGDDYELILAVSPDDMPVVMRLLKNAGLIPFCLGVFTSSEQGLILSDADKKHIDTNGGGWVHF